MMKHMMFTTANNHCHAHVACSCQRVNESENLKVRSKRKKVDHGDTLQIIVALIGLIFTHAQTKVIVFFNSSLAGADIEKCVQNKRSLTVGMHCKSLSHSRGSFHLRVNESQNLKVHSKCKKLCCESLSHSRGLFSFARE